MNIDIHRWEELKRLIKNNRINYGINVKSTLINKLQSIKSIKPPKGGSVNFEQLDELGIIETIESDFTFCGNLKSFGNLTHIKGDVTFESPVQSLGKIIEIEGSLKPLTSDLTSLGELKKIGKNLNLKNCNKLTDLSNLQTVGGNALLNKSLKGKYKFGDLDIKGKISYWNVQPRDYNPKPQFLKTIEVPGIHELTRFEIFNNTAKLNSIQKEFYSIFKDSFLECNYLNHFGYRSYVRMLAQDLTKIYNKKKDFEKLQKRFENLRKYYPKDAFDSYDLELDLGKKHGFGNYRNKLNPLDKHQQWNKYINDLIETEIKKIDTVFLNHEKKQLNIILKKGLLKSNLTTHGQKYMDEIFCSVIRKELAKEKNNDSLREKIFDPNYLYKRNSSGQVNLQEYLHLYKNEEEYKVNVKIHNKWTKTLPQRYFDYDEYMPPFVTFTINYLFRSKIREAENEIRELNNIPKIGEGWISETELYYNLKNYFNNLKIIQHARPKWLGRQHFDIYFKDLNIAVEYQGKQHFEAISIFGGAEGLEKTKENDLRKKKKCEENNCALIEVLPNYNLQEVINEIETVIIQNH